MTMSTAPRNFAVTGVAGFVAPRHLKAINDTGNRLVAAVDPHDAAGILDRYSLEARFFTEFERFDRHLEKLRRAGNEQERVHYVSICSPNYLHDAHIRMALRVGADAICEKPVVINPWNLDALQELEAESGCKVNTVLQLRLHPALAALKEKLSKERRSIQHDVCLTYITGRGAWYGVSWKGSEERSGGLPTNIGIHFFDMLQWLFGEPGDCQVHLREATREAGFIEFERARVKWFLSTNFADLPFEPRAGSKTTYRSIQVDGEELEFTEGFTDLHTRTYEEVLAGRGFGLDAAKPAVSLVHRLRQQRVNAASLLSHPALAGS